MKSEGVPNLDAAAQPGAQGGAPGAPGAPPVAPGMDPMAGMTGMAGTPGGDMAGMPAGASAPGMTTYEDLNQQGVTGQGGSTMPLM